MCDMMKSVTIMGTSMQAVWVRLLLVATVATGCISSRIGTLGQEPKSETKPYASQWQLSEDRIWVGSDLWAADLSAWQIQNNALYSSVATTNLQTVTQLTRQITGAPQPLTMRIQLSFSSDQQTRGISGIQLGLPQATPLTRDARVPTSPGLFAGASPSGHLVLLASPTPSDLSKHLENFPPDNKTPSSIELLLTARPVGLTYTVLLQAFDLSSGEELSRNTLWNIPSTSLRGHFGLGSVSSQEGQTLTTAFCKWQIAGASPTPLPEGESINGPFMGAWHTRHMGALRITAQLMPVSEIQNGVQFQVLEEAEWRTCAHAKIRMTDFTATFEIPDWNSQKDQPYRLVYQEPQANGESATHYWSGSISANTSTELTVAELPSAIPANVAQPAEDVYIVFNPPVPPNTERSLPSLQTWYRWCFDNRDIGRDHSCLGIYHQSMTHHRVRIEIADSDLSQRTTTKDNLASWKSADMKLIYCPETYQRVAELISDSAESPASSTNATTPTAAAGRGYIQISPEERRITYNREAGPKHSAKSVSGWPIACEHSADYDRDHVGYLPPLEVTGISNAVTQVTNEEDGALLYELRMQGSIFLPRVFATGQYTLIVGDPATGRSHKFQNLSPLPLGSVAPIRVAF